MGPVEFFFFVGIPLTLAPGFAGLALARSANIPGIVAFLIGLFGSWLGLIGLYLYGHSQKQKSAAPEIRRPAPADRLRALQALLDDGLITQEEFQERRRATVDDL